MAISSYDFDMVGAGHAGAEAALAAARLGARTTPLTTNYAESRLNEWQLGA